MTDVDSNGAGLFDAWLLRFECGLEIALWQFQHDGLGVPFVGDDVARICEVHANERELGHLVFHVGVDRTAIEHWSPTPTYVGPERWTVLRQDDNGNSFEIDAFTSRCEAEAVAASFAARGHKQLYWVEGATTR